MLLPGTKILRVLVENNGRLFPTSRKEDCQIRAEEKSENDYIVKLLLLNDFDEKEA